ncbi:hypothetical protein M3_0169 [Lysinibacillus phage vB_LfM_LysYB1]|nr:hypothetical protein M3_0169 [Lysinibacillus phage vB_LfM_LysYB1]WAB25320.1 hypothetical protein M5_0142 [Lysinibacillus phage vB_LfM_LysYB2]
MSVYTLETLRAIKELEQSIEVYRFFVEVFEHKLAEDIEEDTEKARAELEGLKEKLASEEEKLKLYRGGI